MYLHVFPVWFTRRSFNISTITASETNVSGITKITLVVNGDDENVLYQIIAQMKKLENVNEAYVLPDTNSLYRELLLVKIKATQEERSALHEMTEIYRGKVVGLNKESMIIELTGSPQKRLTALWVCWRSMISLRFLVQA